MRILKKRLVFESERDDGTKSKIGKIGISARHPNLETIAVLVSPPRAAASSALLSCPISPHGQITYIDAMKISSLDSRGKSGALKEIPWKDKLQTCIQCGFRFPYSLPYSKYPLKDSNITLADGRRYHRLGED